jgi:hypothetical protein
MYSIKNLKNWRGMDGLGYTGSIYRAGHRVGQVTQDGSGGESRFEWNNKKEQSLAEKFGKSLYVKRPTIYRTSAKDSLELYFADLCDKYELDKKLKKLTKVSTLFRLPSDPEGEWRTINKPFVPPWKDVIRKKLSDDYGLENVAIFGE